MTTSFVETLTKVLQLEQEQSYQDRSVIGGIETFMLRRASELENSPEFPAGKELNSLLAFPYGNASVRKRQIWVSELLKLLNQTNATSLIDISPPKYRSNKNHPKPDIESVEFLFKASTALRGVDTKTAERLGKLGIGNIWDLMFNPPRTYLDFSNVLPINQLNPGTPCTVQGEVWSSTTRRLGANGRLPVGEIVIGDNTGNMKCLWFGNRFISRTLKPGTKVTISGKPEIYRGSLVFQSPEYELSGSDRAGIHTGRIIPVYRLTAGLAAKKMRSLSWETLRTYSHLVPTSHLPNDFYERNGLMPLDVSVSQLHFPNQQADYEAARRTLGLEELVHFQLALAVKRALKDTPQGVHVIPIEHEFRNSFLKSLPFELTGSQQDCINTILDDISLSSTPMNRLLQGDVGSGKTVVVASAILATIGAGFQTALMAPTEILAEQHYLTFQGLISPDLIGQQRLQSIVEVQSPVLGRTIKLGLLTGSTTLTQKARIYQSVESGDIDLLIGTQSLINQDLKFLNLNLAVTDEQHRFGVLQRSDLKDPDSVPPHYLTMSATPIPRTLALSIYGDLDISTINELPKGRNPVKTRWVANEKAPVAYGFVKQQLLKGRQAFVVCPSIDQNPDSNSISVTEVFKSLGTEFRDHTVELLHGKMTTKRKEGIMDAFREGSIDLLVSTSVIEVGVDVPNANVMVIHGADRFGLSQLHQFRGRVGRGTTQSYCILISTDPSETAVQRLTALENSTDGFVLAEKDLQIRGPGDYFGVRQSGMPSLKIANIFDLTLMELAQSTAKDILSRDPGLTLPKHSHLKHNVNSLLSRIVDESS